MQVEKRNFISLKESSVGDAQDLCQMEMPEEREEHGEEKGDGKHGEEFVCQRRLQPFT